MDTLTKKKLILIILLSAIIVIGTIGFYWYCQNKEPLYEETETISLHTEKFLKEEAEEILDRLIIKSKQYLNNGNLSFEYLSGEYDISRDANILIYDILYNKKQTSLSLEFETVDSSIHINKVTFNANTMYMALDNVSLEEDSIFLTDEKIYSNIIVCLLVCLPESIDEEAFQNANLNSIYEELYEKEQIRTCGYDISVKGYTKSMIDYTFEKIRFVIE